MSAETDIGGPIERFPPTRQSALLRSRSVDPAERRAAFDAIVRAYWKPAYKYLRVRWGVEVEGAKDLTQGFFTRAMDKGFFERFDPALGSFRSFVRTGLDDFVNNERTAAGRLKRGGGERVLSLDFVQAEEELGRIELPASEDLERVFQREWARRLFELAVEALRARLTERGREEDFELFRLYDLERDAAEGERPTYASLAADFGLPVTTVTNRLASARRELRALVLEHLGELAGSEEEAQREARALFGEP
jgi:RNA polymerase sigma factor (sigma-70 family)